jgi:hypothetical protein
MHVIEGKIEGKIEVTARRGRRCKQLLDDLKEKIGCLKLKEEAEDHTLWTTGFVRGYEHVIEGEIEGKIEVTTRRGRRRKQLLDDLKEKRGYWKLKEEAVGHTQ